MPGSVNTALLIGEVGTPPKRSRTPSGEVVSFSIATKYAWKNNKERTDWHRIVVRNDHLIEDAARLLEGARVWIKGSVQTRKFGDGKYDSVTEVVILPFHGELKRVENQRQQYNDDDYDTGPPDEIPF